MSTIVTNPVSPNALTRATAVTSTSGVAIDFTGIPTWVRKISMVLSGVSTNGSSEFALRIGSGSFDTTGYLSGVSYGASVGEQISNTTCFQILNPAACGAAFEQSGIIILTNLSGNTWSSSGIVGSFTSNVGCSSFGTKALAGIFDRIRLTTLNGTDTFDLGLVNIFYE